jgi:YfiH family protein
LLLRSAPHHGFGLRDSAAPPDLALPRQVHGTAVARAVDCLAPGEPPEADAVVTATPGVTVGVVTADCVPVLLAGPSGSAVAAVHAGWRGLAAGIVEAAVAGLATQGELEPARIVAAIGPHIGPCCYEVDEPVLTALARRHREALAGATRPARAGHALLDLGALVRAALERAGLAAPSIGVAAEACTCCDARRFHSHRRDGARSGRLVHFITAPEPEG